MPFCRKKHDFVLTFELQLCLNPVIGFKEVQMKQKVKEWEESRRLRKEGCSVKEIAFKVGVSPGSVSIWVRDIVLTEEQKQKLSDRNPLYNRQLNGSETKRVEAANIRKRYQEEGRMLARNRDKDFLLICSLYWGEGTKARNMIGMTNCDPDMLKFFVSFLKNTFRCEERRFSVRVAAHTTNGLTIDEINHYWLDKLGLPKECLRTFTSKTKYYGTGGVRKNYHPYGCCCVRYNDTRIVQIIYGGIQEIFGIERPEWLR
jgi:transcriptional regulator with XRE-family HTH domain